MKRLQIAIYNIDIGHYKVYSRDFVTYIIWFIEFLNSEFRILKSEYWNPNSGFRIPYLEKRLWMEMLFLDMPHQGPFTG